MQKPILWKGQSLALLDQRALPGQTTYLEYTDWQGVAKAIKDMVVRGAPAIGITAAYGFVLGCQQLSTDGREQALEKIRMGLLDTRPTAVNLAWALDRIYACAQRHMTADDWLSRLESEAVLIEDEDREMCAQMGVHGANFLGKKTTVLTHCNTGALATGGEGTALAVIRELHRRTPLEHVYVDETRPYLQGSRLTAWELLQDQLPACLITDSMAGWMMKEGKVGAVIVGADRIARNGDVANKIGTYSLAVLCAAHDIPFVVVAPTSTFDPDCLTGAQIEIEYRPAEELKFLAGQPIAPLTVDTVNPSFDVTPSELVSAIITEVGIIVRGEAHLLMEHLKISQTNDFS